jgi:hypothetical protein
MLAPTIPEDEDQRLATLHGLQILDTPPEERFDRLRVLHNVSLMHPSRLSHW